MMKRLIFVCAALGGLTVSGCVAGAGYETYSGPIYYEPAPVVVDEVVVEPRYRRYHGRVYRDRDYRDRRYRDRYHRRYPRG